jgi:hypothetical protein
MAFSVNVPESRVVTDRRGAVRCAARRETDLMQLQLLARLAMDAHSS